MNTPNMPDGSNPDSEEGMGLGEVSLDLLARTGEAMVDLAFTGNASPNIETPEGSTHCWDITAPLPEGSWTY